MVRYLRHTPIHFAVLLTLACTSGLSCCPNNKPSGCTSDSDCKGDRVCSKGRCVSSTGPTGTATTTANNTTTATNTTPPPPVTTVEPPATTPPPAVALHSDGFPVVIPAPSSNPPTMAEWAAGTTVIIPGVSAFGCEPKMVREWLRISCGPNQKGTPSEVYHKVTNAQAYKFVGKGITSVVFQVAPNVEFMSEFEWRNGSKKSCAEMGLRWQPNTSRPMALMQDKPGC